MSITISNREVRWNRLRPSFQQQDAYLHQPLTAPEQLHPSKMALPILFLLHISITAAILLFTIIATASFSSWSKNIKKELYEDEDGVATPESQQAYSIKAQNVLATIVTSAGLGVAIANAVLGTLDAPHSLDGSAFEDGWFGVAIWVCCHRKNPETKRIVLTITVSARTIESTSSARAVSVQSHPHRVDLFSPDSHSSYAISVFHFQWLVLHSANQLLAHRN